MTDITAGQVKELRERTGAGMMDCKRALEEAGGDIEAARKLLRERGMAQAAKRAGRETTEGLVGYRISDTHGTMVAVGCETEPVSKNDEFQAFAKKVLDVADAEGTEAVDARSVLEVFQANAERIQGVVLDLIGRFPADLEALGARAALGPTRGDGHTIAPEDVRLFETGG